MRLALEPGSRFAGRYAVQSLLAEGGMGAVYDVLDENTQRRCALKLMLPEQSQDAALRQRFTLEAQVVAKLENDHVIDIRDFGSDPESGALYMAMELLRGEELESFVGRESPLPRDVAVEILAQLFFGMSAAHAVPVVHRDLKPGNIFVHRPNLEDGKFVIKILDFGIAKDLSNSTSITQGSAGTPLWMAPEQSRPLERILPATDVWALGLLAFYVFTGKIYWKAANQDRVDAFVLMREILVDPLPDPSARAEELGVTLAPGFAPWLSSCLRRNPSERFRDASAAWSALSRIVPRQGGSLVPGAGVSFPAPKRPPSLARPMEFVATMSASELGEVSPSIPAPGGSERDLSGARRVRTSGRWVLGMGALAISAAALYRVNGLRGLGNPLEATTDSNERESLARKDDGGGPSSTASIPLVPVATGSATSMSAAPTRALPSATAQRKGAHGGRPSASGESGDKVLAPDRRRDTL